MGLVSWLVDLEPMALRQAKCVHNATWYFWIIFGRSGIAGAGMGKTNKMLFQRLKLRWSSGDSRNRHVLAGS
jgi:hypothetical protein